MPKRIQPKPHAITGTYKSATDGREDIWIMKRTASAALRRLHQSLDSMAESRTELESRLRHELDASTLTLKWTPNLAHIAHVKGKDVSRVTSAYPKSLSSSKSTRSFQVPEWTQLGAQMDETRFRIRNEEQRVLSDLREGVVRNLVRLRRNAAVLDELDVACAFALLAVEKNFIRPIITAGTSHNIVGGRQHLPSPERPHIGSCPDRILCASRVRRNWTCRQSVQSGRLGGQPFSRSVNVHGGNARDCADPQRSYTALVRHHGRGRAWYHP